MDGQFIRKELYSYMGSLLFTAAHLSHLPINPSYALDGFFFALKKRGIKVATNSRVRRADIGLFWRDRNYVTQISFEHILKGDGENAPPSTLQSLYLSFIRLFDHIGKSIPQEAKKETPFYRGYDNFKENYPLDVFNELRRHLTPYFQEYQENLFLPVGPDIPKTYPELRNPSLFAKVMRYYPLELHEKIALWQIEGEGYEIDRVENVFGRRQSDFGPEYYPTEEVMYKIFTGLYLERLARQKDYHLTSSTNSGSLEERQTHLVLQGVRGLDGLRQWRLKRYEQDNFAF